MCPWVILFDTGDVLTSFYNFPLPKIYLDDTSGSAGSCPQQSLPDTQSSPLPSRAGASAEHPTRALAHESHISGQVGREAQAASENTTLRTLHALGLPSLFLELLSWEGLSLQLPINLAA